ncbi:MAG: DUF1499 domain-containing protein [Mariprofundaceae bacterium]
MAIFIGIIILAGGVLGLMSQQAPELGLVDGRLSPCPDSPNCVSSEASADDAMHFVEPISFQSTRSNVVWHTLSRVIEQQGGEIVESSDDYLHAIFTSRIFRYIDDVEARLDTGAGLIHLRSASRVGHSDLGANRQRIKAIRSLFEQQHGTH